MESHCMSIPWRPGSGWAPGVMVTTMYPGVIRPGAQARYWGGGELEDRMEGGRGKGWSRGQKRLGREWEPSYGRRLGKTSALRPEASNEWAGPW